MTMLEPFGYLNPTGRSPAFHFLKRDNEDGMPVFTADQMRDYATAAVLAEREACAKVCLKVGTSMANECPSASLGYWPDQVAYKVAAAIRARTD